MLRCCMQLCTGSHLGCDHAAVLVRGGKPHRAARLHYKHPCALLLGNRWPLHRLRMSSSALLLHHLLFAVVALQSAPHVSGAAALLWRLFPGCKAADISQALKASAQKLPDQSDLAAGSGLLRVDRAYDWILKNKACAKD